MTEEQVKKQLDLEELAAIGALLVEAGTGADAAQLLKDAGVEEGCLRVRENGAMPQALLVGHLRWAKETDFGDLRDILEVVSQGKVGVREKEAGIS
jgi:hypothetical protein